MARTQAADYEQRREAIVEKAAELFAQTGFRGASVAELASACETSKSLIYHYYQSKEDILFAVMASHVDQLEQDVIDCLANPGTAAQQLSQLVHRFMHHYVGAANRQKVLLNELDSLPPARRDTIVGKQRSIVDAVVKLLGAVDHNRKASAVQLRAKAMMLFGMINWTHTWYDPNGALKPDDIADLALSLIFQTRPKKAQRD